MLSSVEAGMRNAIMITHANMLYDVTYLVPQEIPYLPKIQWSKTSRLKDVIYQFQEVGALLFLLLKSYGHPIQWV